MPANGTVTTYLTGGFAISNAIALQICTSWHAGISLPSLSVQLLLLRESHFVDLSEKAADRDAH